MVKDFVTYKMKLKVLSPVFVGSGDTYDRCDYIYHNKKVNIIEQDRWIEYLIEKGLLDEFIKYLDVKGKNAKIDEWIKSKGLKIDKVISSCCKNKFNIPNALDFKPNVVHSFIKNAEGNPYFPGSSIKGAIVSAIIGYYIEKGEINVFDKRGNIDEFSLRNIKIKGISVSDSTPFSIENLELYKKKDHIIIDYKEGSHELPIYRECAVIGTEVEFTLKLDYKLIKESLPNFDGLETIYNALYGKIQALYSEYGILNNYDSILDYIPADTYEDGVLILGGGAGFHSKSLISSIYTDFNDAFDETQDCLRRGIARKHEHDKDNVICPRGIKLVDAGRMLYMGFCQISEVK